MTGVCKRLMLPLCAVILVMLLGMPVMADVPEPFENGYAHDFAGVLDEADIAEIGSINRALTAANGAEVMLVTTDFVPGGQTLVAYATVLFNAWAVGDAALNNGVLILFATGNDDYAYVMGTGLEDFLSPGAGLNLLYDAAENDFAAKNYSAAALAAVRVFEAKLYEIYGDNAMAAPPTQAAAIPTAQPAQATAKPTQQPTASPTPQTPAPTAPPAGQSAPSVFASIGAFFGGVIGFFLSLGTIALFAVPILLILLISGIYRIFRPRYRGVYRMRAVPPRVRWFGAPRRPPRRPDRYHMQTGRTHGFGGGFSGGLRGGSFGGSFGGRIGGGSSRGMGGSRSNGGRTGGGGGSRGAGGSRR